MYADQNGATAVVGGASSGIGAATARHLAAEGYRLALVARSTEKIEKLAADLGNDSVAFTCDLEDASAVEDLAADIVSELGAIDVLVNNAGAAPERLLTSNPFRQSAQQFSTQIGQNLLPTFNLSYALGNHIRRPGGRIINIGSIAGQTGGSQPGSAGYAAAKAAVHGLTLGLSRELAPEGITVNTVAPGFIEKTGFTGAWADEVVQRLVDATPVGRAGRVEDVAETVAFLASPGAGLITAQVVAVNGGACPGR